MGAFDWQCEYEDRWDENGHLRPELRTRRIDFYRGHGAMVAAWLTDRHGRSCRYCGSTDRLHVDHIRPIARGGSNSLWNLQFLCQDCNLRKGAR
jgi:5-methylcytosine-specific restriction endonuclease McrA